MLKNTNKNTGSTLIEVLVALVIVGLVLTAIAALLSSTVSNSSQADFRQVATRCAQEKMEEQRQLRAENWSSFSTTDWGDHSAGTCQLNDPVMTFDRSMDKTFNPNGSDPDSVSVKITVEWDDGGATRDVEIEQEFFDF